MEYFLIAVSGYLIGSFPSAYLILRFSSGIDIREAGSSSIGAHNSYRVSKSKLLGISVLLIDMLKGAAPVYLVGILLGADFLYQMTGLIAAVLGHCFSPWLRFKGGRGLATAAGGAILLIPAIFVLWSVIWLIAFIFRKNIYFGNISASILTPAVVLTSGDILNKYSYPPADNDWTISISVSLIFLIILLRHIEPLKEWIKTKDKQIKDRER